jgi:hypothetical protein
MCDNHIYYGGSLNSSGTFVFTPLPHIPDGFTFSVSKENFEQKDEILRKIFYTVSPAFQPFLPKFAFDLPFEVASREYQRSLQILFENHGMSQIKVQVEKCVEEIHKERKKNSLKP